MTTGLREYLESELTHFKSMGLSLSLSWAEQGIAPAFQEEAKNIIKELLYV